MNTTKNKVELSLSGSVSSSYTTSDIVVLLLTTRRNITWYGNVWRCQRNNQKP